MKFALATTLALIGFASLLFAPVAFASDVNACAPYDIQHTRIFADDENNIRYTMTRKTKDMYMVTVNLDFGSHTELRSTAHRCYRQFNDAYAKQLGLMIHLYEPSDREPAPKPFYVNYQSSGRGDFEDYTPEFNCSAFVHEALHVAGLMDEYTEWAITLKPFLWRSTVDREGYKKGYKGAFNCRAQSDSIMSDITLYLNSAKRPSTKLTCGVPKNVSFDALDIPATDVSVEKCPSPLISLGETPSIPSDEFLATLRVRADLSQDIAPLVYSSTRQLPQLPPLRPAHIRHLLWPTCKTNNVIYDKCIANAYRTTEDRYGKGCLPVPPVCHELNTWLN